MLLHLRFANPEVRVWLGFVGKLAVYILAGTSSTKCSVRSIFFSSRKIHSGTQDMFTAAL